MSIEYPQKALDFLQRPIVATLVTLMPDNQPQATPVWYSFDGSHVWVNTARGRQKDHNMAERPQVTLCLVDHDNPYSYVEVRGVVDEITEEGAFDHINLLSMMYFKRADFYNGDEARRARETRVIYKIKPTHIVVH